MTLENSKYVTIKLDILRIGELGRACHKLVNELYKAYVKHYM